MKLLIILSLGLLSFGAMAQPDSKFDSPEYKKLKREMQAKQRIADAEAEAKKYEYVLKDNSHEAGVIINSKLRITGDGNTATVAVVIRKTNGQSVKSGTGYTSHQLYKAEVAAKDLAEVKRLIADGIELESKSLFNYIGIGESDKAILTSQGNVDSIDLVGAGLEISFKK